MGQIALLVILSSNFFSFLERYIGTLSSLLFIAFGCAVAWVLLDWYVLGFVYSLQNGCIHVSRAYGKRRRPMADVWLNGIQACGTLQDMRARFPGARILKAVKKECPIAPLAVVYNDAGKTSILLMQPEDALREAIVRAVKR